MATMGATPIEQAKVSLPASAGSAGPAAAAATAANEEEGSDQSMPSTKRRTTRQRSGKAEGVRHSPKSSGGRQPQRTEAQPRSSGGSAKAKPKTPAKNKNRSPRQARLPIEGRPLFVPNLGSSKQRSPRQGFAQLSPCLHSGEERSREELTQL